MNDRLDDERLAVPDDWPVDGMGGCRARNSKNVKCSIQWRHDGTRHRFCQRQPHDGYCVQRCYMPLAREGQ